jgi:hypothetical protein
MTTVLFFFFFNAASDPAWTPGPPIPGSAYLGRWKW